MSNTSKNIDNLTLHKSLSPYQIDQLVELFQGEWWTKGRTKSDAEKVIANSGPIFAYVDPVNNELVAFARTMTDGVYKAMFFDIIVKETWRNSGLGKVLMNAIMSDTAIENVMHKELYCLAEMAPFYEKWGFTCNLSGLNFMRLNS